MNPTQSRYGVSLVLQGISPNAHLQSVTLPFVRKGVMVREGQATLGVPRASTILVGMVFLFFALAHKNLKSLRKGSIEAPHP